MKIYWNCENCGCQTPGIAIFRCNNPKCFAMYCGRCHSGVGRCGCSWEEDDGDGGCWTEDGNLSYYGKICTREEWDAKLAAEEAEEERQRAYKENQKALNEKYQQKLRQLPTIYKLIRYDNKKEFLVAVGASSLYFNGRRLDWSSILEINLSLPCKCTPWCTQNYGGGYILTADGKKQYIKNWRQKEGFWPFRKEVTYYGLWGGLTVTAFATPGWIAWQSEIDIRNFQSMSIYTPSRYELIGE